MFPSLYVLYFMSLIPLVVGSGPQCKPSEQSVSGKALKGHTFKTKRVQDPYECLVFCDSELTCQSYNYVKPGKICELNKRTKEARPGDFVQDESRFYMRKWDNRVSLGSIPEIPAESCAEIKASEQGKAVSGKYWLKRQETKMNSNKFPVYCDITTGGQVWTLIARFSNNDTKNWMNDSGHWWYDRTKDVGETADPSNNADMISPAFWLVSGSELKLTLSNDSQHTPLLQTTGNCLGGQTFRSKVTSYGDFRNGTAWASDKCLGKCTVQYGGQYQKTDGFQQAACTVGEIQGNLAIGFWCDWGSGDGSVMMIGGGGTNCARADHGVGITEADAASFVEEGGSEIEYDFGSDALTTSPPADSYSLNLWIG